MKPYGVDIPVKLNIWIRPECQRKQFEIISRVRPSILFLQSDGGRNEAEWQVILENRRMIDEGIDWDCQVYRLYEDHNNGLYTMAQKTATLVWSKVDRCLFLEDDQLPADSYFRFCAELLEKYKDDLRVMCITSVNYYGNDTRPDSDYFFAGEGCIWGTARWRRTDQMFNKEDYKHSSYTLGCIEYCARKRKKGYEKKIRGYAGDEQHDGHIAGTEYKKNLARFSENQLVIVPSRNMLNNIGFGEKAEHSGELALLPKGIQRLYNQPTHECSFPLKHPVHMVEDLKYNEYVCRVLAWHHPFVQLYRNIERAVRCILFGKWKALFKALNRGIRGRKEK